MVDFGVLGPLRAVNEYGPVNLKGPRHRAVLARLLIANGRAVAVGRLIDDVWDGDPPAGAAGALQTFVGALRKALEPDRPPRTASALLITTPPGYALRAAPESVDALRFTVAVEESAGLLDREQALAVVDGLDTALRWWRGPAYAEFADRPWVRAESIRLDELRALAVARRAEAVLMLGRPADAVPDLEAAVAAHPHHEETWRLLALALYRTGRQGDALAALRRVRAILRDDLGVDPGEPLRELETDILAQSPRLTPPRRDAPAAAAPQPFVGRRAEMAAPDRAAAPRPLVGRRPELATLDRAAAATAATAAPARPGLVLISGEPGVGKTALAHALSDRLSAEGWVVAWGASPDVPGAPAGWPWTQMEQTLAAAGYGRPDAGDPSASRFQRHQTIVSYLAEISRQRPVLLVFDDLHWADDETFGLVTALASGAGAVLVVGAYRAVEIPPALTEALGRIARAEPTRIALDGLSEPQVRELIESVYDGPVSDRAAEVIHARSGGNPFFVRELARLWRTDGEAGLTAVPAGVRDVIRQRLGRLPEAVATHVRQAAVLGEEIDLDVLIALAGSAEPVLSSMEAAVGAGFLVERGADRLAFAHALVRATLYDDIPAARRARWHAAVAEIVERIRPDDVETIAYHFQQAGSRATAARAARYGAAAAERAERRSAPHDAARLWRATVAALEEEGAALEGEGAAPKGEGTGRDRLRAVMGLVRALAVIGDLAQARRLRAEAIEAADKLGDPLLTAEVIGSFEVPAIWTANDDEELSRRVVAAAEATLAVLPPDRAADRARLLIAIAMERRADAGPRGAEAAQEAEAIARRLRDPTLLALALNGRFLQSFQRAGLARQRADVGRELVMLTAGHEDMVTFEVLGHLILIQAYAGLAEFVVADRHAVAADRLAARYELPLVGMFTGFYRALRLGVAGRRDEAASAYRAMAAGLPATGMFGMADGILPLALLSLGVTVDPGEADWGPYRPWVGADLAEIPDSPHDLLLEARTSLHAALAIRAGDRRTMARLYDRLLPAADELAGAGSGLVTFGPVAQYLGDLAAALDRPAAAAEHYRQAQEVAARADTH